MSGVAPETAAGSNRLIGNNTVARPRTERTNMSIMSAKRRLVPKGVPQAGSVQISAIRINFHIALLLVVRSRAVLSPAPLQRDPGGSVFSEYRPVVNNLLQGRKEKCAYCQSSFSVANSCRRARRSQSWISLPNVDAARMLPSELNVTWPIFFRIGE